MPRFDVAHIREQGVNIIIIPLDRSFRFKSKEDQHTIINELQVRASNAGLAGIVVPVWDNGGGQMGFIAPPNWHSFFKNINMHYVAVNINRELYW